MLGIAEKMRDKVAKADKVDDSITDELRSLHMNLTNCLTNWSKA